MNFILNFVALSAFYYALYKLCFARFSFFSANRAILLAIPLLSLLTPLLALWFPATALNILPANIALPTITITGGEAVDASWSWYKLLPYLYGAGVILGLLWFTFRLRGIYSILRSAEARSAYGIHYLISAKAPGPFSFLKHIILPAKGLNEKETRTILEHEQLHCIQWHSADNLYYNLLTTIAWFNPVLYLMARELRQVHECLADAEALKNTSREEYAQMLLSQMFGTEVAIPAHPFFNSSLIKTRITMLYKTKTNTRMKWAYLLLIPALTLGTLYSCSKSTAEGAVDPKDNKVMDFAVVDHPPLTPNCDPQAAKEEQQICFQQGLINGFSENFSYPKSASKAGVEGRVFLQFIINKQGKIVNPQIMRSIEATSPEAEQVVEDINTETVRALSALPDFIPAQFNGTPVAVQFTLPISLKLPPENSTDAQP
jgi:hypothetical protein